MRTIAALLAAAALLSATPGAAAPPKTIRVCAAAGAFWPTMTLALQGPYAWVACKEQGRVVKVSTTSGKTVRSVRIGVPVIAVASGYGSIWALDSGGTLTRLSPATAKATKRIATGAAAAYNIFVGGGSVWVAADQGRGVVRVSPATNRVVARIPAGDGPADMAFGGATAWVMNHRDRVLTRVDLAANTSSEVAVLGDENEAPERMVFLRGSLWITGRGADLMKVNPADGKVQQTIDIGVSGIDVAAAGDTLWVPTRSAATDARGFPTMDALRRVSASTGAVTTVFRPRARFDVHGLIARGGSVWLADNTRGRLYRMP